MKKRVFTVKAGGGIDDLRMEERDIGPELPGIGFVRLKVKAVALNHRDILVVNGHEVNSSTRERIVPCSDCAGVVAAVGTGVTRVKPGDRVCACFFPEWLVCFDFISPKPTNNPNRISGKPNEQNTASALGGEADGVLSEEIVVPDHSLVEIPGHLSFEEASTLPCAGVTAWCALFDVCKLRPGQTVLIIGTGGVSVLALQLAKASGIHAIVTSSSSQKLQRVRDLGADVVINYEEHPDWSRVVLRETGGRGVDGVLDVGGRPTLEKSIRSIRWGGTVAVIGGVGGCFKGAQLDASALIHGAKRLQGVFVGSRDDFEDLCSLVSLARIRPFVDRVFKFEDSRVAFRFLESRIHVGKVVIKV